MQYKCTVAKKEVLEPYFRAIGHIGDIQTVHPTQILQPMLFDALRLLLHRPIHWKHRNRCRGSLSVCKKIIAEASGLLRYSPAGLLNPHDFLAQDSCEARHG